MTKKIFDNYKNQRWSFVEYDTDLLEKIATTFNLTKTLAKVLIHNTGSTDIAHIKEMIDPSKNLLNELDGLCDPSELDKAVTRIHQAQKKNETIYVNGDPDADGISGTAILVAGLRH